MEIARRKFVAYLAASIALLLLPDNPGKTEHPSDGQQDIDLPIPENSVKDLFGALMEPFIKEAGRRRLRRLEHDPGFASRVDWGFADQRINFLLFGYGETHEPPITERAEIGSISVFSLDVPSRKIDIVSFTHDIRAPEIERYQKEMGNDNTFPTKIYRSYEFGGFPLMSEVIENATGLSMDFQIAFHDRLIKRLIDDVFNGVEVEIPEDFAVYPFYLDGKKYPGRNFARGNQRMSGLDVLSYIKTVPDTNGGSTYPKSQEHNFRKHRVIEGCVKGLKGNIANPVFLWRLHNLIGSKSSKGTLDFDFDPQELLLGNLMEVAAEAGKSIFRSNGEGKPFSTGETVYIVDSAHGDGGVQWVNASESPVIVDEVKKGRFPDRAMEVPIDANPNAENLAKGYWGSVRSLVKKRFQN